MHGASMGSPAAPLMEPEQDGQQATPAGSSVRQQARLFGSRGQQTPGGTPTALLGSLAEELAETEARLAEARCVVGGSWG